MTCCFVWCTIGPKFRSSQTSDFGGMYLQDVSACFMTFSILHPDNEGHLWCLHYVFFLPTINKHLTSWKNAWVYHPLKTEKNKSLMQLWIRGLQEAWGSQSLKDEVFQVLYEGNFVYLQMSWAKRGKGEGGGMTPR